VGVGVGVGTGTGLGFGGAEEVIGAERDGTGRGRKREGKPKRGGCLGHFEATGRRCRGEGFLPAQRRRCRVGGGGGGKAPRGREGRDEGDGHTDMRARRCDGELAIPVAGAVLCGLVVGKIISVKTEYFLYYNIICFWSPLTRPLGTSPSLRRKSPSTTHHVSPDRKYSVASVYFVVSRPSGFARESPTRFLLASSQSKRRRSIPQPRPVRRRPLDRQSPHPVDLLPSLLTFGAPPPSTTLQPRLSPLTLIPTHHCYLPTGPLHISAPAGAVFPSLPDPLITNFSALPDPALSTRRSSHPTRWSETR
jgi:hypothetical protein